MCASLGCNAVGVMGCRIIPAPRQRLAALLTNALTPCNGRFPTLILLMTLLVGSGGAVAPLGRAAMLTALLACSVLVTLAVVRILRKTVLRGDAMFQIQVVHIKMPYLRFQKS